MHLVKHVLVSSNDFSEERLDTGFYSRAYFEVKAKIAESKFPFVSISSVCEPWSFGAYALCNEIRWSNKQSGIPFIKAEALGSPLLNFDSLSYITAETHTLLAKSQLKSGDIVVSTSGTIGLCAVLPDSIPKANSNQDTIKFNPKSSDFDNYFLATWFSCKYGQILLQREAGGAVQQHIYLYNFRRLPLPKPSDKSQKYIGNKVRQAEQLRKGARRLENELATHEHQFIPAQLPLLDKRKGWQIKPYIFTEERLDSRFYRTHYLDIQNQVSGAEFLDLGEICSEIRYGSSVDANYVPRGQGIPFIRGLDLARNYLHGVNGVDLDDSLLPLIKGNRLKTGQILITRSGTVGVAASVPKELENAAFGSFMMSLTLEPDWKPEFVAWYLNSWIGKCQIERLQNGAIQLNINIAELSSVRVWRAPVEFQDEITKSILRWQFCQEASKLLTTSAKFLVEALIEGQITETELREAQEAIERGNSDADREILSRLTTKGYGADAPPLFPDLDALYDAINQTKDSKEGQ